ncbi:MAG: hypothetical protein F6K14_21460 [Symploca sp. SIO2C1]|nr:hypothetical protein [Symploca sp. SIO2C1]
MRVWIFSFLVLLGMVELYQWMKNFSIPLPVFIVGGALLAIASNYGKYTGWSFGQQQDKSEAKNHLSTPTVTSFANPPNQELLNQSTSNPVVQPTRSISFTISSPTQEEVSKNGG